MFYFTDQELDDLVMEHLGHFDVATSLLRLENKPAKIQFSTCDTTVVCCTEEAMKIFTKFGIQTTLFTPSGETIEKDVKFFEGEGLSKNIQAVLPSVTYLVGFASGIATRMRSLAGKANETNPDIIVAASRYIIPNTKKIANKAVLSGGGSIHCNELSDTVMINGNHFGFMGGPERLEERLSRYRKPFTGAKIMAETNNKKESLKIARSGIDILQLNDFSAEDIASVKKELNRLKLAVKLAAVGHYTPENIEQYVRSGADILLSSWIMNGIPADLKVSVMPIFDVYP